MSLSKAVGPLYKNVRSDSIGNRHSFHETKRAKKVDDNDHPHDMRSNEEIFTKLTSFGFTNKCCEKHECGCFLAAFRMKNSLNIDYDAAVECFRELSYKSALKTPAEKDFYLQEKFIESIDEITRSKDSVHLQFKMKYSLPLNRKVHQEGFQVCRRVYAETLGFTVTDFIRCSQAFKEKYYLSHPGEINIPDKLDLKVFSTYHRKWNDGHLHSFNYLETEKLFYENLGVRGDP
jgi:hypothetical protein